MSNTAEIGIKGEVAALDYLRSSGFLILDTNWRHGRYELDIVARRGEYVHFVEVKCRKFDGMTSPEDAMTPSKVRSFLTAANLYIEMNGVTDDCRADLVAVDRMPDGSFGVRYIPDAVNIRW